MKPNSNLDFLQTAIHIDEKEESVENFSNIDLSQFNKLFLDPYKNFTVNTAGRLKSFKSDKLSFQSSTATTKFVLDKTVISYITMNLRDLLMSIGSSFLDDLVSIFSINNSDEYENHYEFEYPFKLISEENIIIDDLKYIFSRDIDLAAKFSSFKKEKEMDEHDCTIEVLVGEIFDQVYASAITNYFDKLVNMTVSFYMGKPDYVYQFFNSYFGKYHQVYGENHSCNQTYNYLSIGLRELMKPHIEDFKTQLYIMSNTVSSMILGFDIRSFEMDYDTFMKTNPFAYEILTETYAAEEEDNDDVESGESKDEED